MRLYLGILWLSIAVAVVTAQNWTKPMSIYKTKDTMFMYTWHQASTQRNHLLISDGYLDKISFYYLLPDLAKSSSANPVLIDSFEGGIFVPFGACLTGTPDGKRLFAMWVLAEKKAKRYRLFAKESIDGGLTWDDRRIEFGYNDTFSRRRPTALYIKERLWVFYLREEDETGSVYGATRPKDSKIFTAEIAIEKSTKLATNIEAMEANGEIILEYRKWESEENIATRITKSRNNGVTWSYENIAIDNFKQNSTFFAEMSSIEESFIAVSFVETGEGNKTVKYTYDMGKTWNKGMSNVPGFVRSVSLTSCGSNADKVIGIYSKERDDAAFSAYHVNPWIKTMEKTPPLANGVNLSSIRLLCGIHEGKAAFEALSIAIEKPEYILYLSKVIAGS